jgi:cytochrome c551/c552
MKTTRLFTPALMIATLTLAACGKPQTSSPPAAAAAAQVPSTIDYEANVAAGGVLPPAGVLKNPSSGDAKDNATAGGGLFASMNCDGCHGGGAVGWVGPSLVDGRWRYGGADEEVFTSIFYGRPKGMPAYGGVLGEQGVWMLVAYLKAQAVPSVVPTTSWESGGNAAPSAAPTTTSDSAAPPAEPARAPTADASGTAASASPQQMFAKYGCTACHAVDHKVIGPAFKDVATKYHGQNVEATLTQKVRNGGAGVWGDIPMSPNPTVTDPDMHAMLGYILGL